MKRSEERRRGEKRSEEKRKGKRRGEKRREERGEGKRREVKRRHSCIRFGTAVSYICVKMINIRNISAHI